MYILSSFELEYYQFIGHSGWGFLEVCRDVHSVSVFVVDDLIFPDDIENNTNTDKAKKGLQMKK